MPHPQKQTKSLVDLLWQFILRVFGNAKFYVQTDARSGQLQLDLLKKEGLTPDSKVLEFGCGCLHLGLPLIQYLNEGNYVGVDPNAWLREETLKDPESERWVTKKRATLLTRDDFDASHLGVKFDCIFSHSVLSHCAHWQLEQFLTNCSKVLTPNGFILSSIRLAEGNAFGSRGSKNKQDSLHQTWQYPGVSWFKLSTIERLAEDVGLNTSYKPQHTEFYTAVRQKEIHDWLVLRKN